MGDLLSIRVKLVELARFTLFTLFPSIAARSGLILLITNFGRRPPMSAGAAESGVV